MADMLLALTRRCGKCGEEKPDAEFALRGFRYPGKLSSFCKSCSRAITNSHRLRERNEAIASRAWLKWPSISRDEYLRAFEHRKNMLRKYGVSIDEYFDMVTAQGGRCAICSGGVTDKNMAIDHCHATGRVRGLLCQLCNRALGLLQDDPALVEKALAYLREKVA